jgi:hypothetical protein
MKKWFMSVLAGLVYPYLRAEWYWPRTPFGHGIVAQVYFGNWLIAEFDYCEKKWSKSLAKKEMDKEKK